MNETICMLEGNIPTRRGRGATIRAVAGTDYGRVLQRRTHGLHVHPREQAGSCDPSHDIVF